MPRLTTKPAPPQRAALHLTLLDLRTPTHPRLELADPAAPRARPTLHVHAHHVQRPSAPATWQTKAGPAKEGRTTSPAGTQDLHSSAGRRRPPTWTRQPHGSAGRPLTDAATPTAAANRPGASRFSARPSSSRYSSARRETPTPPRPPRDLPRRQPPRRQRRLKPSKMLRLAMLPVEVAQRPRLT
jgi:hypothetical protein